MALIAQCASCGARLKAEEKAAGKTVKCPKCGAPVQVPKVADKPSEPPQSVSPPPFVRATPAVSSPTPRATPRKIDRDIDDEDDDEDDRPSRSSRRTEYRAEQSGPGPAHSLGIASLVIGVFSFTLCWMPAIGPVVSGLGLALGALGLILGLVRGGHGLGYAIGGSGLSAISLAIGLLWTMAVHKTVEEITKDKPFAANQQEIPPLAQNPAPVAPAPVAGPAAPAAAQPLQAEPEWIVAGDMTRRGADMAIRGDDIGIQIQKVRIDNVALKTIRGKGSSKNKLLIIDIAVVNGSKTKKVQYNTWRGKDLSFKLDHGILKDNHGNKYSAINFGLGDHPIDGIDRTESIYPQKTVFDVLIFEPPVDGIEFLTLSLPVGNLVDTNGADIKFRIPKNMISK